MATVKDLKDTNAATTTISPLLNLPAELRNEIYSLVLTCTTPIETFTRYHLMKHSGPFGAYYTKISLRIPSLLHTCHQFRAETLPIFFGTNIFIFYPHNMRSLAVNVEAVYLGPFSKHIALMRRIKIRIAFMVYTIDLTVPKGSEYVTRGQDEHTCSYCQKHAGHIGRCDDEEHDLRVGRVQMAIGDNLTARGSTGGIDEMTLKYIFRKLG